MGGVRRSFDRLTISTNELANKSGRINRWDSGWRLDETENSAPDKQETAMNRLDVSMNSESWRLLGGIIYAGPLAAIVERLVDAIDALTPLYAEG